MVWMKQWWSSSNAGRWVRDEHSPFWAAQGRRIQAMGAKDDAAEDVLSRDVPTIGVEEIGHCIEGSVHVF
jgi:hypothetical protein